MRSSGDADELLWCNYRFDNSIARRGEFPNPEYISRGFPATQRVLLYTFYNAIRNAKSRINFFKKNLINLLTVALKKIRLSQIALYCHS